MDTKHGNALLNDLLNGTEAGGLTGIQVITNKEGIGSLSRGGKDHVKGEGKFLARYLGTGGDGIADRIARSKIVIHEGTIFKNEEFRIGDGNTVLLPTKNLFILIAQNFPLFFIFEVLEYGDITCVYHFLKNHMKPPSRELFYGLR